MIEIVPFKAAHLAALQVQDAQTYLSEWVTEEQGLALEEQHSYTVLHEGVPKGCAGTITQWQGRATAWAFIANVGPTMFLPIHRAVKHFLDGCYVHRLELTVDYDFTQGHRWAQMLGFKLEAERLRAYLPNGGDVSMYARVL